MELPTLGLDLRRPSRLEQVWAWVFNITIFGLVVAVALNVDRLAIRARLAPADSVFSSLLFVSGAFVAVLLATAGAHELGHLIAGRLAHLRFELLAIGPLQLSRAGGGLRLDWQRGASLFGGSVICAPHGDEPLPVLHRRLLTFALGGPVASFGLSLAAALLLAVSVGRDWPLWTAEAALLTTVVSFIFGLGSLKPGLYGSGLPADGKRIVVLLDGGPPADRWCALVALHGLSEAGHRPKAWPASLVNTALSADDGSLDDLTARLMGYYWAMDTNREIVAGEMLAEAWVNPLVWSGPGRAQLALEQAFLAAYAQGDATVGRTWLDRVKQRDDGYAPAQRAAAAVLLAEGETTQAASLAGAALATLSAREPTGIRQVEMAWLDDIIRRATNDVPESSTPAKEHRMIKGINHIAVIVPELESALPFWRDALGLPLAGTDSVPEEGVDTAFLPVGGSSIELLEPTAPDSGVARFLEKRGPGIHHICFEVDDIAATMDHLRELDIPLINDEPQMGHGNRLYAFVHPKGTGGVLVELYQMTDG